MSTPRPYELALAAGVVLVVLAVGAIGAASGVAAAVVRRGLRRGGSP